MAAAVDDDEEDDDATSVFVDKRNKPPGRSKYTDILFFHAVKKRNVISMERSDYQLTI